jgi:hypothetical protein
MFFFFKGKWSLETIVQHKPETIVESDIFWVAICNTIPVILPFPYRDILKNKVRVIRQKSKVSRPALERSIVRTFRGNDILLLG